MLDPQVLSTALVSMVRAATAPLRDELKAMQAELGALRAELQTKAADIAQTKAAVDAIPRPDVDKTTVEGLVATMAALKQALDELVPVPGPPGADADPEHIKALVAEAVTAIPPAAPGEPGRDAVLVVGEGPPLRSEPSGAVYIDMASGGVFQSADSVWKLTGSLRGPAGAAVDPAELEGRIAKALAVAPRPKDGTDGRSVSIEDAAPVLEGCFAKWALDFEHRAADTIQKTLDRIPTPKDGKDGADALSVEDFAVDLKEDGRTLVFKLAAGERTKAAEVRTPWPLDVGTFTEGAGYVKGDGVSYGGQWWTAQVDTPTGMPGQSKDWRLGIRKGRDGKDGEKGEKGETRVVTQPAPPTLLERSLR